MRDFVLLNLRISMWGVSRVLPDRQYEVDADKNMVRATKKILQCPEYEFLLQLKRRIHNRLRSLALPGEILPQAFTQSRPPWCQVWNRLWKTSRCAGELAFWVWVKPGTCGFARLRNGCGDSMTKPTIPPGSASV